MTCSTPTFLFGDGLREPLHEYGYTLGVAFQIVDDLLDISQKQETLGKPSCGDLVEGKRTLPILYMRDALDDAGRARLDAMKGQALSDADKDWVAGALNETGARERTEEVARRYASQAQAALDQVPAGPYRQSMA